MKYLFRLWDTEMELELKVQNLTDAEVEWTQGGLLYERYRPGVSYSLGLNISLE